VAAGHAVLRAAGGDVRQPNSSALHYGLGDLRIPGFIAAGQF
jgi:3'-phosphoadenosine 5'-phosphosulfate (PAPS) 3'-phosphatase